MGIRIEGGDEISLISSPWLRYCAEAYTQGREVVVI